MTTDVDTPATDDPPPPPEAPAFSTLTVRPKGRLAGRTLEMRYPSVGFLIALKRGTLDDETLWEEVLDAIVDHDLDREPARLTPVFIRTISDAWVAAMTERAVPPASGTD